MRHRRSNPDLTTLLLVGAAVGVVGYLLYRSQASATPAPTPLPATNNPTSLTQAQCQAAGLQWNYATGACEPAQNPLNTPGGGSGGGPPSPSSDPYPTTPISQLSGESAYSPDSGQNVDFA
jgi:hypothetical protein